MKRCPSCTTENLDQAKLCHECGHRFAATDNLVLRVFNPTWEDIDGEITFWQDIKAAWLTNMNEERREELKPSGKTLKVKAAAKKILTIELEV